MGTTSDLWKHTVLFFVLTVFFPLNVFALEGPSWFRMPVTLAKKNTLVGMGSGMRLHVAIARARVELAREVSARVEGPLSVRHRLRGDTEFKSAPERVDEVVAVVVERTLRGVRVIDHTQVGERFYAAVKIGRSAAETQLADTNALFASARLILRSRLAAYPEVRARLAEAREDRGEAALEVRLADLDRALEDARNDNGSRRGRVGALEKQKGYAVAMAQALAAESENDAKTAVGLYEDLCAKSVKAACNRLGVLRNLGRGSRENPTRANAAFSTGCDLGDAEACTNLARNLESGRGAKADRNRAQRAYKRGCDLGDGRGCTLLGVLIADSGRFGRANANFESGCALGDPLGCVYRGVSYDLGLGGGGEQPERAA
ncbi:MAG: tetratricopeptide repeat protein, partial [Myxococcota bacterium]